MSPTQNKTPRKSPSRNRYTPGDLLGQNKTQQSILKYYCPVVKNEKNHRNCEPRKQLLFDSLDIDKREKLLQIMEVIVLSDDEEPVRKGGTIERCFPKCKIPSSSRKSLSLKIPVSNKLNVTKDETVVTNQHNVTGERSVINRVVDDNDNDVPRKFELQKVQTFRKRKTSDSPDGRLKTSNSFRDNRDLVENSPPIMSSHYAPIHSKGSRKKFKSSKGLEVVDDDIPQELTIVDEKGYVQAAKSNLNSPLKLSNMNVNILIEPSCGNSKSVINRANDSTKTVHNDEKLDFKPVLCDTSIGKPILFSNPIKSEIDTDILTLSQIDWSEPVDFLMEHPSTCHQIVANPKDAKKPFRTDSSLKSVLSTPKTSLTNSANRLKPADDLQSTQIPPSPCSSVNDKMKISSSANNESTSGTTSNSDEFHTPTKSSQQFNSMAKCSDLSLFGRNSDFQLTSKDSEPGVPKDLYGSATKISLHTDLSQFWEEFKHEPSNESSCTNEILRKVPSSTTELSQSKMYIQEIYPISPTKHLLHNSQSTALSKSVPSKVVEALPSTSNSPKKLQSSVKRSPNKVASPVKCDKEATSGNLVIEHSIHECLRYAKLAIKLNATNEKVVENFLDLDLSEKILLHHILMRKWTWIRDSEMKYDKIAPNKIASLNILCAKGFMENANTEVELEVLLNKLRLPELTELCKSHKLPCNGTKKSLISELLKFLNCQRNLGFTVKNVKTIMKEKVLQLVSKCVRLTEQSRAALQEIFEASMSPIYLEGQYYSFQERLRGMETLMNEVKFNGKKLIPFKLTDEQLFIKTIQFDQYITSVILKLKILSAKERKDTVEGIELARDARSSLMIYLHKDEIRALLDNVPGYAWRFTAGSNYTSAVDIGVEFFKKSKDYATAILFLSILLGQGVYRKHCRGHWYAETLLIMGRYQKKSAAEMYQILVTGLKEDLTPIGHLELSKRAEMVLNKKKGGLNPEEKNVIRRLIKVPSMKHTVKEIRAIEAPNVSSGTRQTYVEYSKTGDQVFSNVEQTAMNSYLPEYPEILHDEGSFVKNIILAVFWPIIYKPMDHMFISKYQKQPLDWGTQSFYTNRRDDIVAHVSLLKNGGIDQIMQQIVEVVTNYLNYHSLVNWQYICHDMLPTIKNILLCLTLDKFFDLADYLLRSFRERRSGWPDLTLWNPITGTFKFVEVKSPNDELSIKQIVWLEKLSELGIQVEECRVNPTNKGKRQRQPTSEVMSEVSQEV